MSKTLRDNKGQYAGSIGDGKTRIPTAGLTIIPPITSIPEVATAISNVEKTRQAYEAAQQTLAATKLGVRETAALHGIKISDDDNQTILTGTLDDGTKIDVTIAHTIGDEIEDEEDTYLIRGKINNIDQRIILSKETRWENWYGYYRKADDEDSTPTPNKLANPKNIKSFTIRAFATDKNNNKPIPETVYAVPRNEKGEKLGYPIPYKNIPEEHWEALQKEMKEIIETAHKIKDTYETN